VTRVNDIMGEIASASDEQRRGIEQVAQAVSQMDQCAAERRAGGRSRSRHRSARHQADHLSACVAFLSLKSKP
jgi:methyl-accepting chemotaxis protein-4 (peptide sensor receptor)